MFENDEDRDPLEVLAAEFMERQRRGETPAVAEYTAQYPELASDIEELFPTIAVMERLKARKEQESGARVSLGGLRLERLGDFRILGEIGRGGMGIVYEAFQESLGRPVAVKVLPRQSLLAPQQLRRFQREAQTAARLHHTNIVPVFGVGEHEGFHYIVMQLIQGAGLDAVLARLRRHGPGGAFAPAAEDDLDEDPSPRKGRDEALLAQALLSGQFWQAHGAGLSSMQGSESNSTVRGRAEARVRTFSSSAATEEYLGGDTSGNGNPAAPAGTAAAPGPCDEAWLPGPAYWRSVAITGLQVAEALSYAHSHHTLHRDIKPANLLLDLQGVAWITDFGLAKAMEQDNVTQSGAMVGTLRYMAPEQFSGCIDARSDIYSLGLTLYEMLVLRPAFEDTNRSNLIARVTRGEPARPRKVNPGIPRDLETIVLKAIAREPGDRYQTAGELARDLQCFLEDRPVRARRTSAVERLWRWARRNRAVAALAACTLMLLVAVAIVASAAYVRTTRANVEEQKQRRRAEETTALALEALDSIFQQFAPDRSAPVAALSVVGETGEEIAVPAHQPVLSNEAAAVMQDMLKFYDRLADQEGEDARLRRKVAEANRRVGDIRQRLGQFEESKTAYQRAVELYTRLADTAADDANLRAEIARVHNELGSVLSATNRPDEARAAYASALAMLTAEPADASPSPRCRYELARTYYFLGKRPFGQAGPGPGGPGGPPKRRGGPSSSSSRASTSPSTPRTPLSPLPPHAGEESIERAVAMWRQLASDDSPWPAAPRDAGKEQAAAERPAPSPPPRDASSARPSLPLVAYEDYRHKAIELLERLVADHPDVPDYRHLLARCYREAPPTWGKPGEASAPDTANKAAEILEKLVKEHGDVPDYRYDLSETYAMLDARALFQPGAFQRAANASPSDLIQKALALSEELVAEHPNIPDYAFSQVHMRLRLSGALRSSDSARAETHLQKAFELQSTLVRRFPRNPWYKFWLAVIQESRAGLFQDRGQLTEASSLLRSATALLKTIIADDPKAWHVRGMLARDYVILAEVLRRAGDATAAAQAEQEAQALRPGPSPHQPDR